MLDLDMGNGMTKTVFFVVTWLVLPGRWWSRHRFRTARDAVRTAPWSGREQ